MSSDWQESFSRRHGYRPARQEISIREDAPEELRVHLLETAREIGLSPSALRRIICRVLRRRPDAYNWSEYPNVWNEVQELVYNCEWFRVYDIVEAIYQHLAEYDLAADRFEEAINDYFHEDGVGWQLAEGKILVRGAESFDLAVRTAEQVLLGTGRATARNEIHEALLDLSRRPVPDLSGSLHHAMAALECVAREIAGDPKATLGKILDRTPGLIPRPLDEALSKMWGYASQVGRHVQEGRTPSREETELVVGVVAAATTYLAAKSRG